MSSGALWRRSGFWRDGGCVEVRELPSGCVAVRQSTAPADPLVFTAAEWAAFVKGVQAGDFDLRVTASAGAV